MSTKMTKWRQKFFVEKNSSDTMNQNIYKCHKIAKILTNFSIIIVMCLRKLPSGIAILITLLGLPILNLIPIGINISIVSATTSNSVVSNAESLLETNYSAILVTKPIITTPSTATTTTFTLGIDNSTKQLGGMKNMKIKEPAPMSLTTRCKMSEFTCTNGQCVPLNKFCNIINDCGDGSDEPRFCTRCNRTYYGELGLTYSLELHRPKQDRVPYICVLTFAAASGIHGDIVQVTLESFTMGRFTSYIHDGCPDGYLQISEATRSPIGGMWCGASWGPVLFYSETRSLTFTIRLNKLARDQSGYNFDFRIRYKVLSKDSAVARYGGIKFEDVNPWYNTTQLSNNNSIDGGVVGGSDSNKNSYYNSTSTILDNTSKDFNFLSSNAKDFSKIPDFNTIPRLYQNYSEPIYYLGDLIPGTYCSRIFSNCDKKICRLQSPNYPGIYPRNLTCYYAVRQHDVPPGKHALITVRQPKGNLVWVATPTGIVNKNNGGNDKDKKFEPKIKTWNECNFIQDFVTVYDGYTTRDPVIIKFCGGGQSVPAAISSGPELLVEFTTSPYGTFIGTSSQILPLYGFQLEIEVQFVDLQSPTYTKNKKLCEFWVRGGGRGILENPKHSLAPNTTCLYHLQGMGTFTRTYDHLSLPRKPSGTNNQQQMISSRFKVWISMLKFDLAPEFGQQIDGGSTNILQTKEDCNGMLRIWDGPLREPPVCKDVNCDRDLPSRPLLTKYGQNFTNIIARFCQGTIPRTCDRANINDTHARPCTVMESFVSSGDTITLELKNLESTALRPLNFKLRYEFVDLHQDGLPITGEQECSRKFVSSLIDRKDTIVFRSVRNIFMFGRGGTTNLKCVYRFEAQRGERVRIQIRRVNTMNRECSSRVDEDINRSFCYGNTSVKLEIFERPYHDSILLSRGCLCNSSDLSHLPVEYTSTSRDLEVHFTAYNMTTLDDPDTLNFEGVFEFVKGPVTCKDGRRKYGPSGTIDMTFGDLDCRNRPWIIEPSNGNKYLYVRVKAIFLKKFNPKILQNVNASLIRTSSYRCETRSRVVLTTSEGLSIIACPLGEDSSTYEYVEIFSAGWNERPNYAIFNRSKAISVEFLRPENGNFKYTWMEMIPRPLLGLIEDCKYRCAEIDACVNASVWCDGIVHCPSGDDESFLQCSSVMKLPAEFLATICILFILFCFGFVAFGYKKIKRQFRGSSVLQTRLKSLSSMDTAVFDEKDVIC